MQATMTRNESDDPLSSLAPFLRVKPELQDFCRFGGTWVSPHEASGGAQFHIVTRGHCVFEVTGHGPVKLGAGDTLLLPHGDAHVVCSVSTDGTIRSIVTEFRNAIRTKLTPGVACDTELVCGVLRGEAASEQALIAALPNFVVLRSTRLPLAERLHMLAICISDELDSNETGSTIIATNLATALFVMMLREHLKEAPPASGLLALLTHRSTSHAVLAMLREPARDWTLDLLAKTSAASRATLVRSFRKLAGLAPLAFLTELRLGFARQRLMTTNDPICVIAADVGYQSEGALSRALLRRYGVRPSKLRLGRSG
ncbi:helix-turn-helix domain-containing protein [Bradyrhizobium neotropicale]|nr:helix-turn-helix domain-containing protein [Bradyrhizobium neotropicale]